MALKKLSRNFFVLATESVLALTTPIALQQKNIYHTSHTSIYSLIILKERNLAKSFRICDLLKMDVHAGQKIDINSQGIIFIFPHSNQN